MKKTKEKKKTPTYVMTYEQIEAIKKKAFEDGVKSAIYRASTLEYVCSYDGLKRLLWLWWAKT